MRFLAIFISLLVAVPASATTVTDVIPLYEYDRTLKVKSYGWLNLTGYSTSTGEQYYDFGRYLDSTDAPFPVESYLGAEVGDEIHAVALSRVLYPLWGISGATEADWDYHYDCSYLHPRCTTRDWRLEAPIGSLPLKRPLNPVHWVFGGAALGDVIEYYFDDDGYQSFTFGDVTGDYKAFRMELEVVASSVRIASYIPAPPPSLPSPWFSTVPLPASALLLPVALMGFGVLRRRKRRSLG